ncbi:MAG: hypothetical protein NTY70_09885 [Burkholderiales bacterium]|nr:hypothetical protein [Burkholderiales bacterium]
MNAIKVQLLMSAVVLASGLPGLAAAQENAQMAASPHKVEIIESSHHDHSFVLRDTVGKAVDPHYRKEAKEKRRVPYVDSPNFETDAAAQLSHVSSSSKNLAAPTSAGLGFDGMGQGFSGPSGVFAVQSAPPDTTGAVGASQFVQWVNSSLTVFNKATGAATYGPVKGNTLFSGFGGACETSNDGDPVVQYDKIANRWVLMQFAVPNGGPYFQCIAVSKTSDATGGYNRYAFQYSGFNDYPKAGVWPDAYYLTYNMFVPNTFGGAKVCAMDRAAMVAGAATATQQCFQLSTSYGGLLPADLDGTILPAAGTPNYMINLGTNSLNMWKFHVDWVSPGNSTLTGPSTIPVTAFNAACAGGTCIPQAGTSRTLDSLADRAMYRLAYRKFADGHEALVVNHAVKVGSNRKTSYSATRWYEIRNLSGTPTVYQQSTYAPDNTSRWMGSVAMDKMGNIALGYSASSSAIKPALRFATRLAADPVNTLSNETLIMQGTGSQTGTLSRWGDYSHMSVDPVDDCTFWYTSEYLKADGTFNWSTRVTSFKINGCQ